MSGCGIYGLAFLYGQMLLEALDELRALRHLKEVLVADEAMTVPMTTSDGVTHRVSILIRTESGVSIGFQRKKDGTLALISDAGAAGERQRQEAVNAIRRQYAYRTVVQRLKQQGYTLVEEKKMEDNSVRLVLRRWM